MPRFLALEWDAREARVAVARTRGSDLVVEHAFAVDLEVSDGQSLAATELGKRVAASLSARNIGRIETLVAVGRANIELRQLSLPPSPVEELPELVRFQALRQFTTINEEWPIDFIHVDAGESESLHVIAAAISPDLVKQIQATCESADQSAKRLILRPFAAASLLHRHDKKRNPPCTLMVDLLAEEADLTVMVDNQVAMMRTVRLSTGNGAEAQSRALLGEIRRTIAAAQNQLSGHRVDRIVMCGDDSDDQSTLKLMIETQLKHTVEMFDPFSELQLEAELASNKPQHPGRFAPLLGMLADEVAGAAHAIDFLHPREKPTPPSQWRSKGVYIGLGVAVSVTVIVMMVFSRMSLDARIAELRTESRELEKTVGQAKKKTDDVNRVEEFLKTDYAWLDELKVLSDTLPSADDVILTQLNLVVAPGGGQVSIDGYARESNQIQDVQQALRVGGRNVVPKGGGIDPRRDEYKWLFKELVVLEPRTDFTANLNTTPNPVVVVKPEAVTPPDETASDTPPDAEAVVEQDPPTTDPQPAEPVEATPAEAVPNASADEPDEKTPETDPTPVPVQENPTVEPPAAAVPISENPPTREPIVSTSP